MIHCKNKLKWIDLIHMQADDLFSNVKGSKPWSFNFIFKLSIKTRNSNGLFRVIKSYMLQQHIVQLHFTHLFASSAPVPPKISMYSQVIIRLYWHKFATIHDQCLHRSRLKALIYLLVLSILFVFLRIQ